MCNPDGFLARVTEYNVLICRLWGNLNKQFGIHENPDCSEKHLCPVRAS